jgi:cardiolipin synthase A/B
MTFASSCRKNRTNVWSIWRAASTFATSMKCKVLLYTPGMVHAKAMLVDDAAAAVGSANFDSRSMFLNFEVSSVLHSPAEVLAVAAWIEKLMTQTRPMDGKVGTGHDTMEGIARLIAAML